MELGAWVFLVFLVLKLAGIGVVATWSWLWVLSPLWIGLVLDVIFWGFILLVGGTFLGIGAARSKRRKRTAASRRR